MKVNKIYNGQNKNQLHGNLIIWKYMSVEKFISMLSNNSLYFSNASFLEDKFEISIPNTYKEYKKANLLEGGLDDSRIDITFQNEEKIAKSLKENTYLNCWSLNEAESYALWKIYLSGSNNGIAIKSTISKLIKSIENKNSFNLDFDSINLGKVNYGEISELNKTNVILTKRAFYDYEREIRLFIRTNNEFQDMSTGEYIENIYQGFSLPIDVEVLIDSIVLSPFAPKWFNTLVPEIIEKFESNLVNKIDDSQILI